MNVGIRLVERCAAAIGRRPSHSEVAHWACESVRMEVKQSSWNVYRSAHLSLIEDGDIRAAVVKIYSEHGRNKKGERRARRPSKRLKVLSENDLHEMISELKKNAYKQWGKAACVWLISGFHTGARPSEWKGSKIVKINSKNHLRVRNSKIINFDKDSVDRSEKEGRNRTLYRNIPIHHLPEKEQQIISMQSQTASKMDEEGMYNTYYEAVRKSIYRASERVWPEEGKKVTLYSCRHSYKDRAWVQMRALGLTVFQSEVIVAVLMGQGSKKTQYAYGVGSNDIGHQEELMAIDSLRGEAKILLGEAISSVVG